MAVTLYPQYSESEKTQNEIHPLCHLLQLSLKSLEPSNKLNLFD